MPQEFLDSSDIISVFYKMGGEAVTKAMTAGLFGDTCKGWSNEERFLGFNPSGGILFGDTASTIAVPMMLNWFQSLGRDSVW